MGDVNQHNEEIHHTSIEISQLTNRELANSITARLLEGSPSSHGKQCSIYRVDERFHKINKYAYTPEIISIGPFHRGKKNLRPMEYLKSRYVHDLLSRTATTMRDLEKCIESIKEIESEARRCYSEPPELSSNEFVEMMLFDGLFIIELFLRNAREVNVESDDPIFSKIWGLRSLARDLVLLENQLPMLVFNCLFELPTLNKKLQAGCSITKLALNFFNPLMPRNVEVLWTHSSCCSGKHFLDLLCTTFHPNPEPVKTDNCTWKFIPSATELKRAGIKFKKGSTEGGGFLDIKFSHGVLEIPPIIIQDHTDSLFRNLIASEQCCDGHVTYMTSYAFFMDSLIKSAEDVQLLHNKGIITNYIGDDEDVFALFNKLSSEISLANFCYSELCYQVKTYYETRCRVWRATLMRTYFDNPWAFLSLLGATFALGLTFMSTLFAMLSFFLRS